MITISFGNSRRNEVANSKRYHQLSSRLSILKNHFLPKQFSPTGTYSRKQLDLARGYRLLAHAEVEAFIEDIAWDALLKKVALWKSKRKASDLIICFLSCYHSGWGTGFDEEGLSPQSSKAHTKAAEEAAESVVDIAVGQFRELVSKNHGVREINLRRVVLPIGVRISGLDQSWINTMDTFGKLRGEVAHKAVGVQQQIDPYTEYQNVQYLLTGLKTLDELVRLQSK